MIAPFFEQHWMTSLFSDGLRYSFFSRQQVRQWICEVGDQTCGDKHVALRNFFAYGYPPPPVIWRRFA